MKTKLLATLCILIMVSGSQTNAQTQTKPLSKLAKILSPSSGQDKARPADTWAGSSEDFTWDTFGEIWNHDENTTYSYDINGNVIEELHQQPGTNDNISRDITVYDVNNNETESFTENWNNGAWELSFGNKNIYVYDSNKRIQEETYQFWNGSAWINSSKTIYTRDANGVIETELFQNWENGMWVNSTKTTYTINQGVWDSGVGEDWENGMWVNSFRFVDVVWHDFEKLRTKSATVETYDNGNWVPIEKFTTTVDNLGGYQETIQEYVNGTWTDSYRQSERFDDQGNVTEDTYEEWMNGAWELNFQELNTYTYNASDEMLSQVSQYYDNFNHIHVLEDSLAFSGYFVGINELPELANTSIYPNPVNNHFQIEVKDQNVTSLQITISDLNGRKLINQSAVGNTSALNIEALEPGIYLVNITASNGRSTTQRLAKY